MTRTVSPSPEQLSERARESLAVAHEGVNKRFIALDIRTGNIGRQGVMWVETTTALAALESTQSEIARLTTVSGDMVEEMARAIYQASAFEAERVAGPDCVVSGYDEDDEDAREFVRTLAQAAATIAKGRMEAIDGILAEAERLVLDGHPSRALLRVEEARAALKDSPNVG